MDISNTSLQAILESSPTAYALFNQDDNIVWINSAFTRIFGYSYDECIHQNMDKIIAPDGAMLESFGLGAPQPADSPALAQKTLRLQKNGRHIYVSMFATAIFDEAGEPHTCYQYTDITSRIKAEQHASVLHEISHAINSSQDLDELYASIHLSLGKIIDTKNFFIALYDSKSDVIKFVYYTDVAEEVGKEIEIIEQASQAKGSYTAKVIFQEQPILLTAEQIAKDYSSGQKPVGPIARSWLGVPLTIKEKTIGAVAVQNYELCNIYDDSDMEILQSVTEQIAIAIEAKRTEQELIESEYLHKTLFNQSVDAIIVHDLRGTILKVNDVAVSRFGYSEAELLTMSMGDVCKSSDGFPLEDHVIVSNDDEVSYTFETVQLLKSGLEVLSELHGKQILYKGNKAIICSVHDITEKKAREDEKLALEKRLNRAKTMQALGQLAGGVAHDLNNILSGISSYPDLILHKLPEDSPLRNPLETIKKSGFKAAEIVDDMLTLTRLGNKNDSVINLNHSIREFLLSPEYLKLKDENPNVQVLTTYDDELLNIEGSDVHLSKVFLNIIKNGFEAIVRNGRILIETGCTYLSSQMVTRDVIPEGEYVTVRISDSGNGIAEENIEHIFEPFYTTKQMGNSGTGLGMAIVWRTMKDHNGYIDLQSSEESGTAFTLYFPASRSELDVQSISTKMTDCFGNGELVYVVDDVPEQRVIASSILKELGYQVLSFESGEEVIAFLQVRQEYPALFILDMVMKPGIDGVETFRSICKMAPNQKALIASGFSELDQIKAASKSGISQYLKKPYSLEDLALAVKKVLDRM